MMTAVTRRRVLLAVLAGGALAGLGWYTVENTNLLGAENYCSGLVSQQAVESVLKSSGKISESVERRDNVFVCRIDVKDVIPWKSGGQLTATVSMESELYPFSAQGVGYENPGWDVGADFSLISNGVVGGVTESEGMVLLSASCDYAPFLDVGGATQGRPVLGLSVRNEGLSDWEDGVSRLDGKETRHGAENRNNLAGMLSSMRQGLAEQGDCRDTRGSSVITLNPADTKKVDRQSVCGIPGFSLPVESDPGQAQLEVQSTNASNSGIWLCDVWLKSSSRGPQIRLAVVQNKELMRSLQDDALSTEREGEWTEVTCSEEDLHAGISTSKEYWSIVEKNVGTEGGMAEVAVLKELVRVVEESNQCSWLPSGNSG